MRLSVSVSDRAGRPTRAPGLGAWLARVAPSSARGEVAIALVSDAVIRTLNRTYRGKDATTDVLSFAPEHPKHLRHRAYPEHLGDVVISTNTARRQARQAGHAYATELKVLALHGLLHLLGYDHHAPSDRGRMARLERRLRAKGGLRGGLIERARAGGGAPASTKAPAARARRWSDARRSRAAERARAGGGAPASTKK